MNQEPRYLGFIEMPHGYSSLDEWLETQALLLSLVQTDDVKELLAECEEMIAFKQRESGKQGKP